MEAESGYSSKGRPINLTLQAQQRVMSLQCAIAMSLGIHPSPKQLQRALLDKSIQAAYGERKVLLGRKLSPTPEKGLVTTLPSHNLNRTKQEAVYRMVDVVSCIEVLAVVYSEELPPEFLALKASLLKLDLPSSASLDFCRKTGVNKSTPSNWMTLKTPIPLWVDAYLGTMQDLAALHTKYLATTCSTVDADV